MFYSFVCKMEEELQVILEVKEKKLWLKVQRQVQQVQNVQCKQEQWEVYRKKSLEGMKKVWVGDGDEGVFGIFLRMVSLGLGEEDNDQEDDDIEYFCQVVGEVFSEDLFFEVKWKWFVKFLGQRWWEID